MSTARIRTSSSAFPDHEPADAIEQKRATAIKEEIDRLRDAMDAVGDVMLAESVHQAVQGNYDRAKGALQAANEGNSPREIDVVTTPRSGRSLTHRVALHLNPAQTTGWPGPVTPRAASNAPLNHWLATMLPPPADVQCKVTLGGVDVFINLGQFGLQPIDVVLLSGDRFGDGSSELERLLAYIYRRTHAVPEDVVTLFPRTVDTTEPAGRRLVFDAAAAQPGKRALAVLLPLLGSLRRLLGRARPLDAQDHALPVEAAQIDPANPKGWDDDAPPLKDVKELKERIESAWTALNGIVRTQLEPLLSGTVLPLYEHFHDDPDHALVPQWASHLETLRQHLEAILRFGVIEAMPLAGVNRTAANVDAWVPQARTVVSLLVPRLEQSRKQLDLAFATSLPADPQAARPGTSLSHRTACLQLHGRGASAARPRLHAAATLSASLARPLRASGGPRIAGGIWTGRSRDMAARAPARPRECRPGCVAAHLLRVDSRQGARAASDPVAGACRRSMDRRGVRDPPRSR